MGLSEAHADQTRCSCDRCFATCKATALRHRRSMHGRTDACRQPCEQKRTAIRAFAEPPCITLDHGHCISEVHYQSHLRKLTFEIAASDAANCAVSRRFCSPSSRICTQAAGHGDGEQRAAPSCAARARLRQRTHRLSKPAGREPHPSGQQKVQRPASAPVPSGCRQNAGA